MAEAGKISELLDKIVMGEFLAEEERLQLLDWASQTKENRRTLEKFTNDDVFLNDLAEYAKRKELADLKGYSLPPKIQAHFTRIKWIRISAAAAAVLVLSFGVLYMYSDQKSGIAPAVVVKTEKVEPIAPAAPKAILTLADNSKILLDTQVNGTIAAQGSIQIQAIDGQLTYLAKNGTGTISTPGGPVSFNTVTVPRGGFYRIGLPDGTRVWLNAESSLKFPAEFRGDDRVVELTGEGYFEVAKALFPGGKKRIPFMVKTGESRVEVTGTHFNINAYSDAGKQVVTLLEGSVVVHSAGDAVVPRALKPGERGILVKGSSIGVEPANTKAATSWMKGRFSFDQASIRELMQQLSRWYNVEVVYASNFTSDALINGSAERTIPLAELLTNLQGIVDENLVFKLEGKKIIVSRKN